MSEDLDPDRLREAAAATAPEDAVLAVEALMHLIESSGEDELVVPAEAMAAYNSNESGKALFVHVRAEEGTVTFRVVDDPPSAQAQAVLDGGGDWLHAESGRSAKVTGADGDEVIFVVESPNGGWSEPLRWHSGCFLRDHVLSAGVPLLGGDDV